MANQNFGRYQLIKKLATGGMAEVWLAHQVGIEGFHKLTVVKRILPHLADDPEFVKMFKHEALIAARFNHPNIAQIYEFGEANGTYFIAMEFVHGEDMGRVMRKAWSSGNWIPQPLAIRMIASACEALYYAHSKTDDQGKPLKVVHRDISPQNILVSFDGSVKVVDFGIAKAADQASLTKSGAIKGKFAYMAPEQAAGKPLDARSDIFALGLVLYELLTGVRPLKRDNEIGTLQAALECDIPPPSTQADCPKQLDKVVMKALAKAADDRYRDARQFQMELEEFLVSQRWVASSVQLSEMMGTLFKDRIEEEARLGHPEPASMESMAAATPMAVPPPQRDRSPPTEQNDPAWDAPPGSMEPPRERMRTNAGASRTMAKGNYNRTEAGTRAPLPPPPDVPDWEAPPATEYDARRAVPPREPTLIGRSRSMDNVPARSTSKPDATQIGRTRSETGLRRRNSVSESPAYDDREEDPRTEIARSRSRTQVPATNTRRRATAEFEAEDRGFERAGSSEDPDATRLPPPGFDADAPLEEPPPREPPPQRPPPRRAASRAAVPATSTSDSLPRRRLSKSDLQLTPEQKYGVAPPDDDELPKQQLRPEDEAAIARALAREKSLQKAKRIFFAALAVSVLVVVGVFHKPILAALMKKPMDNAGVFVTVETNIPITVYVRHAPGENAQEAETLLGDTPLRGAPGAHLEDTLILVNKDRGARREIELSFGQPGEVKTFREEFHEGRVKLRVTPKSMNGLKILRDGKEIATYRPGVPLTFFEGVHELELNGPQLKEGRKFTVDVKKGELTETENLDLTALIAN